MTEKPQSPLYQNDAYEVFIVDNALDEDNRGRAAGYGIFNKTTGIREATGLVFGEVRWRADQFANMIRELDARDAADPEEIDLGDGGEDVVLN